MELEVLHMIGLRGIKSYLCERRQYVSVHNCNSEAICGAAKHQNRAFFLKKA